MTSSETFDILSTIFYYAKDSILLVAIIIVALIVFPKYRQLTKDKIAAERQAVKDRIEADEKMWQRWGEREANLLNVINECTSVMSGLREIISISVKSNSEHLKTIYEKLDQISKSNMRLESKQEIMLQNQWSGMGQPVLANMKELKEGNKE
jgi:hypothetical protein